MRKIVVEGLSPIASVLREILPKTSGKAGESGEGAPLPPIHLAVLESCQGGGRYDTWPSLIGLTCQPIESAMMDPQLVSFDVQEALLLKMPFDLNDLLLAIERFPRGAVRLFRHPGVNLLWHYKEFVASNHPNPGMKKAIDRRVRSGFPELTSLLDRPREFFQRMTERIMLSLYSGLSHDRHSSLEALITDMACSYSNQVPQEAFLSQVGDFFQKTDQVRRELVFEEAYFGAMIEAQSALRAGETPLVGQFQPLHQSLNRGLQRLETEGKDFLSNQGSSERVFEASYQAAQALGTLLEEWDKLRRRVQP